MRDETDKAGFTSTQAIKITKITYSQLDQWDRTNFIKPSYYREKGAGHYRHYSKIDLLKFMIAKRLIAIGMDVEFLRHPFKHLEDKEIDRPKERWLVLENKILRPVDTHQYFRQTDMKAYAVLDIQAINRKLSDRLARLGMKEESKEDGFFYSAA